MNESKEEIVKKKTQEIITAQQIGFSIMQAINLIFSRWKEKGWETVNAKNLLIKIEISEAKPTKHKENNNKNQLYR